MLIDLATDAAPGAARVRVVPVVQLAVVAALVSAADGTPTLLVNPIVTAVGASDDAVASSAASGAPPTPTRFAPPLSPIIALPLVTSTWSYDDSIASCASAVQSDCGVCLAGGQCDPIWTGMTGMEACTLLAANPGRNYALLCANLAVSLSNIAACIADHSSSCPIDAVAIDSAGGLNANAEFLDDQACVNAMSVCLTQLYGIGGSDGSCGSCSGCDCGSCDSGNSNSGSCNDSTTDDGCNDSSGCGGGGGGCNDSSGGGGCNGGGGGGNCSVARQPSRGAGLAAGLIWVLLPVPAALWARRRPRRRERARPPADPA